MKTAGLHQVARDCPAHLHDLGFEGRNLGKIAVYFSKFGAYEMIKKKPYDGVVESVRYTSQGAIDWVRVYERHGFVFSDRVILNRAALLECLKAGKRLKTGKRIEYQGNDFKIYDDIRIIDKNGTSVIVAGQNSAEQDVLGNLPII